MDVVNTISSELQTAIAEGSSFGTKNTTKLSGFIVKVMFLIIPGIVLGHYIDQYIAKLKRTNQLGNSPVAYIGAQLLTNIAVLYGISKLNKAYTQEFQNTYAGLFFVSLFFGMQTNLISSIQEALNVIYTV